MVTSLLCVNTVLDVIQIFHNNSILSIRSCRVTAIEPMRLINYILLLINRNTVRENRMCGVMRNSYRMKCGLGGQK